MKQNLYLQLWTTGWKGKKSTNDISTSEEWPESDDMFWQSHFENILTESIRKNKGSMFSCWTIIPSDDYVITNISELHVFFLSLHVNTYCISGWN